VKVLVVDDEALARERLRALVLELPGTEVVGEAANGLDALRRCAELTPDVVLLDIRMPGADGLQAARHLAGFERPPAVIFTTAFGEHALEAFDAQAVDYLVKPVRRNRLEQALARAARLTQAQLAALHPEGGRTHLSVRRQGEIELIPVEEVLYLQADQKYVTVRHRDGEALIEDSLKTLEEELSGRFIRIHRAALVARTALGGLERTAEGGHRVRLRGCDERLEVSRRHLAELKRLLREARI
jgi:two-component system response regulator AlgR